MAIDVVTLAASVGKSKKYTDDVISSLGEGMKYKGSVASTSNLPEAKTSNKGWLYTISSNGHEYVSDGTQWVDLSADLANKLDTSYTNGGITTNLEFSDDDLDIDNGFIAKSTNSGYQSVVSSAIIDGKPATAVMASNASGTLMNGIYADDTGSAIKYVNGSDTSDITLDENGITINGTIVGTNNIEKTSNKVTSMSASSTDTQYPSAKCVHDELATKQAILSSNDNVVQPLYVDTGELRLNYGNGLKKASDTNALEVKAGKGARVDASGTNVEGVEYKNASGVAQANAMKFVKCTQAEYTALGTYDSDTFYVIVG